MGNYKHHIIDRKDTGKRIEMTTTLVEVPVPCKQCKKNAREHGSSRCADCTNNHWQEMQTRKEIKEKIEQEKRSKLKDNDII